MKWRSSRFASSSFRESAAAALVLALLVFLWLSPVLAGGRIWLPLGLLDHVYPYRGQASSLSSPWNPLMWDGVAQFGVWRTYAARSWKEGWLPLWNPHQGFGYPLYANSQSAIFYLPNWLHVWLEERAFGWLAAWHLWWAGLGTWLLLRRQVGVGFFAALVAATAYPFSLWMVSWQMLPTLPATASWLPWVVWGAARWASQPTLRQTVAWGAVMGMCLLAGHLQIAFYVILAGVSATLVGWRFSCKKPSLFTRQVLALLGAFLVALAWSAPQLLPALELSLYSHRRSPATAEGYTAYIGSAMPLAHLITLFLPDFFGHPAVSRPDNPEVSTYWGKGNYAEFACYLGVPTLALALVGAVAYRSRWRIWAVALALVAMLLALGTPLNALLYYGVPGFSGTGSPARVLVLWAFATAALAAMGVERSATLTRKQVGLVAVGLMLLWVVAMSAVFQLGNSLLGAEALRQILSAQLPLLGQGVALALLAVGGVWLANQRGGRLEWSYVLALACVGGSLWTAGAGYNYPAEKGRFYPETPLLQQVKSLAGKQWRIIALQESWSLYQSPRAILPPNLATVYGLYDLQVYDSLLPLHAKRQLDLLNGRDSAPLENGNMMLAWHASVQTLGEVGVRYVLALQPLEGTALKQVAEGVEGYLYEVIGARGWVRTDDGRECVFQWVGGNRLRIEVPEGAQSLHVLQTFYPGWKASSSASIRLLGSVFQEVPLRAGESVLQLVFAPDLLQVALYFALLAWGGGCACLVVACRR